MVVRVLLLLAAALSAASVQLPAPRTVTLIVANGTVVTVDGGRRIIPRGSVAIEGRDIVAVDTADVIAARYRGRDTIDAAGAGGPAGLAKTPTPPPRGPFRGPAAAPAPTARPAKHTFPPAAPDAP